MLIRLFYLDCLDQVLFLYKSACLVFIIIIFCWNSLKYCKQCRPGAFAVFCGVWFGPSLFDKVLFYGALGWNELTAYEMFTSSVLGRTIVPAVAKLFINIFVIRQKSKQIELFCCKRKCAFRASACSEGLDGTARMYQWWASARARPCACPRWYEPAHCAHARRYFHLTRPSISCNHFSTILTYTDTTLKFDSIS